MQQIMWKKISHIEIENALPTITFQRYKKIEIKDKRKKIKYIR